MRQGSCLSPAIFNVFINVLIVQLKKLNIGCRMSGIFVGCLLYADDIILLSPSVTGLQEMLNTCYEIACTVSLQFNVRKCHCLVVGKMHNFAISPMMLAGQEIKWCDHIKYLGIYLAWGRVLKSDVNPFYAACNSIFTHSNGISEIALLNLLEAYSLC